jgi:hypothetical protein
MAVYNSGTADASWPFAGANSTEARVTDLRIFEDGSGFMTFENNRRISFLHNFLYTLYMFDNKSTTVYDDEGGDSSRKGQQRR